MIDVNGTRYHLLLGREDWASRGRTASGPLGDQFATSEGGGDAEASWDARRHEVTLGTRVFHFLSAPGNRTVNISERRGSAADRFGNVYSISASRTEIVVTSAGSRTTTHFWSSLDAACGSGSGFFSACRGDEDPAPIVFSGMAVTSEHYLVAGTLDPKGLVVFDLRVGGEPRQLLWPAGVGFIPFDLAAGTDGGVWILDRDHRRVWYLDRAFHVHSLAGTAPAPSPAAQFSAIDGSASNPPSCYGTIDDSMAVTLPSTHPVSIEALPDGTILILDSDPAKAFSDVFRFRGTAMLGAPATTESAKFLVEEAKRAAFRLVGHDFVYVETALDGTPGVLYVAGSDGDQAVAFVVALGETTLGLEAIRDFYPMRLFGAKALITVGGLPHYDSQSLWVPLVTQKRSRYARRATIYVRPLDGKEPQCVWHRLMLDGCFPEECTVRVWSRASEEERLLPFAEWDAEPQLMRRATGSEIPWANETRGAGNETWELLFQRAKGRYLELKIVLAGNGRSTPRIRALRAWYPRFSYVDHYLPAVYRENEASASFLDRYLANVESFFTTIEDRIASSQTLLDPRSAPDEVLDWLAAWFGIALDPAWDEPRRRLFLRHAAEFFEWRGTIPGVLMALRLVFDECADESIFEIAPRLQRSAIRIAERFRSRGLPPIVLATLNDSGGLPQRASAERWQPSLGASDLHRRWAEHTGEEGARYSIRPPARSGAGYARWASFSIAELGFVPSAGPADAELWREELRRRYSTVAQVAEVWSATLTDWSDITLPTELPEDPEALLDWVHFEAITRPARESAHRFVVFLPQGALGVRDRERRLDLARRVVALEKPAHTTFDVEFYWAFFRVGDARLGSDTFVDRGSRSEELLAPFVLDRNYLGAGWLPQEHSGPLSTACSCPPSTTGGCA